MSFRICIFAVISLATLEIPAVEPVSYQTHIRQIFRRKCNSCHNASRSRAGLDLSSYAAALNGSSSGAVLVKGDPDDSILFLSMTHKEEPFMPPGNTPVDEKTLHQVRLWIELGLPEKLADVDETLLAARSKSDEQMKTAEPAGTVRTTTSDQASTDSESIGLSLSPVYRGAKGTPVTALAVSPDGKRAAVSGQMQVVVFDLMSNEAIGVLPVPEGEVFKLKFSPDGASLLAGCGTHAESGKVVLWDVESGQRVYEIGDEYDVVLAAAASPDLSTVVLGGPERILKVVDLKTGKLRKVLDKHTDWVLAAEVSHDGLLFATSDRAGNVYTWETDAANSLHSLRGHRGPVQAIAWSSSGDHCYTAGHDGTLRIWDMHTGDELKHWTAHESPVVDICLTNEQQIVTVGRDKMIKKWTLDGELVSTRTAEVAITQLEAVSAGEVLLGTIDGRLLRVSLESQTEATALQVPDTLVTQDIAAIQQTAAQSAGFVAILANEIPDENVGNPVVIQPEPSASATVAANQPPQPPMSPADMANEIAELSATLPTLIAKLKAAESDVEQARQELAEANRRTRALLAAQSAASQSSGGIPSVIGDLEAALGRLDKMHSDSDSLREVKLLTRLALERAREMDRSATQPQAQTDPAADTVSTSAAEQILEQALANRNSVTKSFLKTQAQIEAMQQRLKSSIQIAPQETTSTHSQEPAEQSTLD